MAADGYIELSVGSLNTADGINQINRMFQTLYNNVAGDSENIRIFSGYGSPEAVITAGIGSLYLRANGGAGTALYIKESGTGNTGWVTIGVAPGPASPGGSSGDIQYNNSGSFGGFGDWNGSTLTVGGAIDVGSSNAFYLGDPTTNGSWRIIRSGNNLAFERRESGSWVEKTAITP